MDERDPHLSQEVAGTAATSDLVHEIESPLAGVIACVELLRHGTLAAEERSVYLDAMEEGLNRVLGIARALSEGDDVRREPIVLGELLASCVVLLRPLRDQRRASIELKAGDTLIILGDRRQLAQAVTDVLVNALQASPCGGRVTVATRVERDEVQVAIEDEGPGFDSSVVPSLGTRRFTTKAAQGGSGIGLSIARRIVEGHGGTISFENRCTGGARVTLRLPRRPG